MPNLQTIELEVFKRVVNQIVSRELIEDWGIKAYVEKGFVDRDIRIMLRALQVGHTLDTVVHKYPTSWRDAVKDRFAPAWVKRRWPVKYTTIKLESHVIYPQLKLPEHYNSAKFYVHKEVDESYGIRTETAGEED